MPGSWSSASCAGPAMHRGPSCSTVLPCAKGAVASNPTPCRVDACTASPDPATGSLGRKCRTGQQSVCGSCGRHAAVAPLRRAMQSGMPHLMRAASARRRGGLSGCVRMAGAVQQSSLWSCARRACSCMPCIAIGEHTSRQPRSRRASGARVVGGRQSRQLIFFSSARTHSSSASRCLQQCSSTHHSNMQSSCTCRCSSG